MKTYTGINIQYPISQLILSGEKVVETRTYPIPEHYVGKELAIVETPGSKGDFASRIVGTITFSSCFKYSCSAEFYDDVHKHYVDKASPWKWSDEKPKWGWVISKVKKFSCPIPAPSKRGIVYTKDISI